MNSVSTRKDCRLIVGMGATGLSVARYLLSVDVDFVVTDSRAEPPKARTLAELADSTCCYGSLASPLPWAQISEVIASPGVPLDEPLLQAARAAGVPIIGDIELFARVVKRSAGHKPKITAITGSNGKSTVTALVAEMARAAGINVAIGGNFGTPALDLLDDTVALYVLELSSFQLELTHSLAAHAACVLNISSDHIDRHGSLTNYAAIKARIYNNVTTAVVNNDDALVANMPVHSAQTLGFSAGEPTSDMQFGLRNIDGEMWLARGAYAWLPVRQLKLHGQHNYLNALAASALGVASGLPQAAMLTALRNFGGLAHRCQRVASIDGVDWVNDSKGTNVGAMLAAIQGLSGPIVLLAGGLSKGGDFSPIGPVLAQKGRLVLLFGADAAAIENAIRTYVSVTLVADMQEAINVAAAAAQPGDTVLLSPGCASFDMFRNYQDRGEQFTAAVLELAA